MLSLSDSTLHHPDIVSTKTKVQVYSGLQGRMCLEIFMGPFKCINPVSVPPSTLLVTTVRPECDRGDGNIMTDKAVRWQSRPRPDPDLNSRLTLLLTCHQQTNKQTQTLNILYIILYIEHIIYYIIIANINIK